LLYDLNDNKMVALGSPDAVSLAEVMERCMGVLTTGWVKTKQIHESLDEPKPSLDQLIKALETLTKQGISERNPPIAEGKRQGVTFYWRRAQQFTSGEPSDTFAGNANASLTCL